MELSSVVNNDQTRTETDEILRMTRRIKGLLQLEKGREFLGDCLKDKLILVEFMQPSTRTKLKCEMAGHWLGAKVLVHDEIAKTSMAKGEVWLNHLLTLSEAGVDILAIRHPESFLPIRLSLLCMREHLREKIINLGDGNYLHPTQGLGDLYTIEEHHRGKFDKKKPLKIAIGADMKARAVHSLIISLSQYPVELTLVSWQEPEYLIRKEFLRTLIDNGGKATSTDRLTPGDKFDVIYWIRYQIEHGPEGEKEELQAKYNEDFLVTPDFLKDHLEDDGCFLHPGPMTKEIDISIRSDSRMIYGEQLRNNQFVMMALYIMMLRPDFYVPRPQEL